MQQIHPGQGRKRRQYAALIDLQKAYDTVNREKLWRILNGRCKNETDQTLNHAHRQNVLNVLSRYWQALLLRGPGSGPRRGAVAHALQRVPGGGPGLHLEAA